MSFPWAKPLLNLLGKEAAYHALDFARIDCPAQDTTPGTKMRHRFSSESEQVGKFALAQLSPLGSGTATALPCQLGENTDHQQFCKWIAHPAPLSSIFHTL